MVEVGGVRVNRGGVRVRGGSVREARVSGVWSQWVGQSHIEWGMAMASGWEDAWIIA